MLQNSSNLNSLMEQDTISKNGASSKSQMSRIHKKRVIGIAIASISILFCLSFTLKSPVNSKNDTNQIIGVWKIVSPELSGEGDQEKIKIITKGHFIWTHTLNNGIALSLGGDYTYDGETYTENIKYGTPNMNYYFSDGRKASYQVKFEDNKMYIFGGIEDKTFNEVWERVE